MENQENRLSIGRINGVDITPINKDGLTLYPVGKICEALGISFPAQYTGLTCDPTFSPAVSTIETIDEQGEKSLIVCLPAPLVNGWLFTINPRDVVPQARESLMRYRDECNDVLYRHFFNRARRQAESNQAEAAELERLRQLLGQEQEVKSQINETKKRIDSIRATRDAGME